MAFVSEQLGAYNDSESVFSRPRPPVSVFYPNRTPAQPNAAPGFYTYVGWDLRQEEPLFQIDSLNSSLLVCLVGGIYLYRVAVSRPSGVAAEDYVEAVIQKNPDTPGQENLSWYQGVFTFSSAAGYPQSAVMEGCVALIPGDILRVSEAVSVPSVVLGLPQGNGASNIRLRRLGGLPGPA